MQEDIKHQIRPSRPLRPNAFIELLAEKAGLNLKLVDEETVKKLRLLDERTNTLEDESRGMELGEEFFSYCRGGGKSQIEETLLTPEFKLAVKGGTFLSDIGKAGPWKADPLVSAAIADMYGVEVNLTAEEKDSSIDSFFDKVEKFRNEKVRMSSLLRTVGINTEKMTMREFYRMHSAWTVDILKHATGVPLNVIVAASIHHMLEEEVELLVRDAEMPTALRQQFEKLGFSSLEEGDKKEKPMTAAKLVVILDKYDAARGRGKTDHETAIERLWNCLNRSERFKNDEAFKILIEQIDIAFKDTKLYDNDPTAGNGEFAH